MYADHWHGRQLLICMPIVGTDNNFWFVRRSLVWTTISSLYADRWYGRQFLACTQISGLYADHWHGRQFLACTRISGLYADFWIVRRSLAFGFAGARNLKVPTNFNLDRTSEHLETYKKPAFRLLLTSGKQYGVPPMA